MPQWENASLFLVQEKGLFCAKKEKAVRSDRYSFIKYEILYYNNDNKGKSQTGHSAYFIDAFLVSSVTWRHWLMV